MSMMAMNRPSYPTIAKSVQGRGSAEFPIRAAFENEERMC